jgi:putative intracellular protease/amidase
LNRLTLIGRVLRANADARAALSALMADPGFNAPLRWDLVQANEFDGLLLPGGHRARGMRQYLESTVLQNLVATFFSTAKPVAAICHGVLLAARSIDPATGKSVLYGRRTTALTWALESTAARIGRFARFWDRNYYRTYVDAPGQVPGYMSVESEVTRALAAPGDFCNVAVADPKYARKTSGTARDTANDVTPAFVVIDGHYISARWPGDVHHFAQQFCVVLSAGKALNG